MDYEEIEAFAFRAYRERDYVTVIECCNELMDNQSETNWTCRLYLAMAYYRLGRADEAKEELRAVMEWCPDRFIADKAVTAIRAMNGFLKANS